MVERLRSDFWVAAHIRRCFVENVVAMLRRRGAAEAGAVWVKVDHLDGTAVLYAPAPQSAFEARGIERLFVRAHADEAIGSGEAESRLSRETRFDPDLWIVEVEDRQGRSFLDLADDQL